MRRRAHHRGVTLVELVVVIAILGLAAGVAGLAFRPPPSRTGPDARGPAIAGARARALATGARVTVAVDSGGSDATVTAHPDGSVLAAPALTVERLTGKPTAPTRPPHAP